MSHWTAEIRQTSRHTYVIDARFHDTNPNPLPRDPFIGNRYAHSVAAAQRKARRWIKTLDEQQSYRDQPPIAHVA